MTNQPQPFAVPFIRREDLPDRRAAIDYAQVHMDECYRIRREHDDLLNRTTFKDLLNRTTFKLYCGPNLTLTIPIEDAGQLLTTVIGLGKLAAGDFRDYSPRLPIKWQYVETDKGPVKKLLEITYIEPVHWTTDNERYKRFVTDRAKCGEQFLADLLGEDKSKWPSEADSLSIVKKRQADLELGAHIPRFQPKPVEDTPVNKTPKTLKDYFKDDSVRKTWWPNARGMCANHGITDSKKQSAYIHTVLNVKNAETFSANDFVGTPEQATKLLEQSFNGKSRPTMPEIDAAREKIKAAFAENRIADKAAYKLATGDENLPASIEAGKSLDSVVEAVKTWAAANQGPEKGDEPAEDTETDAPAGESEPEATPETGKPVEPVKKLEPSPILSEVKTLTGIPVGRIAEAMNRRFPAEAYGAIPKGVMKGKTDLGFEYVRDRFDQVFGPHGFGWKFEPHPVLGKVEYRADQRTSNEGREYTKHIVTYLCHVLKYAVVVNDQITWIELSPMSDSDENEDLGYACRGAFTSLLKQALRGFGGMNHILKGEYTHEDAKAKAS